MRLDILNTRREWCALGHQSHHTVAAVSSHYLIKGRSNYKTVWRRIINRYQAKCTSLDSVLRFALTEGNQATGGSTTCTFIRRFLHTGPACNGAVPLGCKQIVFNELNIIKSLITGAVRGIVAGRVQSVPYLCVPMPSHNWTFLRKRREAAMRKQNGARSSGATILELRSGAHCRSAAQLVLSI